MGQISSSTDVKSSETVVTNKNISAKSTALFKEWDMFLEDCCIRDQNKLSHISKVEAAFATYMNSKLKLGTLSESLMDEVDMIGLSSIALPNLLEKDVQLKLSSGWVSERLKYDTRYVIGLKVVRFVKKT